tara:strand:- start:2760 stop:3287 length:528 start_codon:yes stop_codon:yes gene_type:complete
LVLPDIDPGLLYQLWWTLWVVNALLIWTFLDILRRRGGVRGWNLVYHYSGSGKKEDQSDRRMSVIVEAARKARQVPLVGWLLAALVFVAVIAYHFWRKANVLGQRLVVETKLGQMRKRHADVIKGNDKSLAHVKTAIEDARKGKERKLEAKSKEIRKRSANLDSLAKLANEVFTQ